MKEIEIRLKYNETIDDYIHFESNPSIDIIRENAKNGKIVISRITEDNKECIFEVCDYLDKLSYTDPESEYNLSKYFAIYNLGHTEEEFQKWIVENINVILNPIRPIEKINVEFHISHENNEVWYAPKGFNDNLKGFNDKSNE